MSQQHPGKPDPSPARATAPENDSTPAADTGTEPFVVAVVLTWNNFADTDECLTSLMAQTYPNLQVLVVDNGSTDNSPVWLRQKWGEAVAVAESERNLGCGGGYAFGISRALAQGADYVALIDNDTVSAPGLIARLMATLREDASAGLATAVMTYYDEPSRVWFARGRYSRFLGITRHAGLGADVSTLGAASRGAYETEYVPSCAVLMSRQALEVVGLPDERLFFGHDDVDWCLRARDAGFKLLVVAEPLVRHKVSTTGGRRGSLAFTDFSAYHHARGSMVMARRHARGWRLAPYLAGQVLVRWPYYSALMLREGRLTGPFSYLAG
ncbi:MAG TPA: glycosyltransferase family 2 protein, partial [Dehalococcoidia bacterium]